MSFQDEYKITNADRLDKGVYGLPDTPGMTTAAIQERFDSLGNLAIDKFNALVEAASDVVDGSDTKFPTNKAVEDYISGEGGAIIDDTTPSLHKAYSSSKVESMFSDFPSELIDDSGASATTVYSSSKVEEIVADLPTPESVIDDDTASTDSTYSSSKLESDFISVSDTEEQTATDEFTTINGGLLTECKVALLPIQDLHGYDHPYVGGAGKNKVPLTLNNLKAINTNGTWSGNDYEYRGVTYSVLADDADNVLGIKANGQATQNSLFVLWVVPIFTSTCILSGCPANGSVNTYHLQYSNYVNYTYEQIGTDVSVTQFDAETYPNAKMQIIVSANYTANDLIFTPMLRASGTSADFEPYSNICPITGHTQVEVGDDGKNCFDISTCIQNKYIDDDGTINNNNAFMYSLPMVVEPNEYYTFSGIYTSTGGANYRLLGYDKNDNFVSLLGKQGASASSPSISISSQIPNNVKFVRVSLSKQSSNCQLEKGNQVTAYVPYNGYQITVNLGGTYYSGTLDVVSGVFTVTHTFDEFDGSSDENWTINGIGSGQNPFANIVVSDNNTTTSIVCNEFTATTIYTSNQNVGVYKSTTNLRVRPDFALTDATAWKTWLSSNHLQVCYPIATPFEIQLTPQQIETLVGKNHLSAPLEGQEITESVYSPLAKWNAVIDDTTASDDTTYSSNKINAIVPKIDDTTTSATKVFSSLKTAALITELSERFDFSTTEKPLGWWTDGKVYYGKVINIMGCPKEMFGLMVDLGVEVDTFIGLFAVGDARDDNYNGGYCMGGTIYCKVIKSEGQNTQIQPACAVMALSGASLLVLYTKVE